MANVWKYIGWGKSHGNQFFFFFRHGSDTFCINLEDSDSEEEDYNE